MAGCYLLPVFFHFLQILTYGFSVYSRHAPAMLALILPHRHQRLRTRFANRMCILEQFIRHSLGVWVSCQHQTHSSREFVVYSQENSKIHVSILDEPIWYFPLTWISVRKGELQVYQRHLYLSYVISYILSVVFLSCPFYHPCARGIWHFLHISITQA